MFEKNSMQPAPQLFIQNSTLKIHNFLIILLLATTSYLPIYGQTEKPLSEFEEHRQKAIELYKKKDLKNYLKTVIFYREKRLLFRKY